MMNTTTYTETQAEVIRRVFDDWDASNMLDGDRYDSAPDKARTYTTVDQLMRDVTASGSHYFDRATMAWFKSRVLSTFEDGRFMVVSDRRPDGVTEHGTERVYRVAYATGADGQQLSMQRSDFYKTAREAATAARLLADAFHPTHTR